MVVAKLEVAVIGYLMLNREAAFSAQVPNHPGQVS